MKDHLPTLSSYHSASPHDEKFRLGENGSLTEPSLKPHTSLRCDRHVYYIAISHAKANAPFLEHGAWDGTDIELPLWEDTAMWILSNLKFGFCLQPICKHKYQYKSWSRKKKHKNLCNTKKEKKGLTKNSNVSKPITKIFLVITYI